MRIKTCLVLLLATALGGCGFSHRYDASTLYPAVVGSGNVGLAVMDVRPGVLDGSVAADWVGSRRDSSSEEFEVTTKSGSPLSQDVQAVVAEGLQRNGFDITPVELTLQDLDRLGDSLSRSGAERNVLLRIYEWKTHSVTEMQLDYRLALEVFDADGARLALNELQGQRERMGAVPLASAESALATSVMSAMLTELFNEPQIRAALARQ